ncbi:protein BONZAI 3-like isoform X3 [Diospyros lotus]|uniref:protein BONZAI 3-like isoform X3 n=1 Tax=Diospyros lotus TaxID=55363 RepID=UPI00224E91E6|nr:protein BONZAI 3-like isoform X3 [Diospyros lotus]
MGNCFSDVKGGQQAVGGAQRSSHQTAISGNAGGNDAAHLFFRSKGLHSLYAQIEYYHTITWGFLRLLLSFSSCKRWNRIEYSTFGINLFSRKKNCSTNMRRDRCLTKRKLSLSASKLLDRDIASKMLKLKDQEFLGEANCVLSEIVTKRSPNLTLHLQNKNGRSGLKNLGTLSVHAEETVASGIAFEITFRCSQLVNKDLFSKSDPFLRISRLVENGGSVPICKTEVVSNNLNPIWKPLSLTMQQLGSKDNPLVIECFDFNNSGNHGLIGKVQKSIVDLEKLHKEKTGANFILPSSRHHGHEKVLKSQLFVDGFREKKVYSFLDYVSSGFELNFLVAVDFTASNGNPRSPDSLHYIDPAGRLNAYQQAIMEVGEVLQFYDSDRRFPAWGFGGKTYDGSVSHCFNLNGSASDSEVEGIEGIMAAYSSALYNISLSGPTLFGQVINKAAEIATHSLSHNISKYFVLLIITDGVLTDLQETKNALVRASDLPLSVLIVGVGNADFKQMEILDADNGQRLESSTGRIATRDIVQFVPLREIYGGQISVVQSLLEELPGQFLTYMSSRDIIPHSANAPPAHDHHPYGV